MSTNTPPPKKIKNKSVTYVHIKTANQKQFVITRQEVY